MNRVTKDKKRCPKCGEEKASREFYAFKSKHDGLSSYCIICFRKYIRERGKSGEAKTKRRSYYKKPEVVARMRAHTQSYRENNRGKNHAQQAVQYAVRVGKLKRPDKCTRCHKEGKVEAHHIDYSKQLEVIWVCRACHAFIHRKPVQL